jgi:hypothetical protein
MAKPTQSRTEDGLGPVFTKSAPLVDPDVAKVVTRFRDFFQRIRELSEAASPPGQNCANGWFQQYMLYDSVLNALKTPTGVTGDQAGKLDAAYVQFYQLTNRAFLNGNVNSGPYAWLKDAVEKEVVDLLTVLFETALGLSVPDSLVDFYEGVLNALWYQASYGGGGANGWIAVFEHDAATWTLPSIDATGLVDSVPGVAVIKAALVAITSLNTSFGNVPFLPAVWQVQFEAIMAAAVTALDSIAKLNTPDHVPVEYRVEGYPALPPLPKEIPRM